MHHHYPHRHQAFTFHSPRRSSISMSRNCQILLRDPRRERPDNAVCNIRSSSTHNSSSSRYVLVCTSVQRHTLSIVPGTLKCTKTHQHQLTRANIHAHALAIAAAAAAEKTKWKSAAGHSSGTHSQKVSCIGFLCKVASWLFRMCTDLIATAGVSRTRPAFWAQGAATPADAIAHTDARTRQICCATAAGWSKTRP